MGVFSKSDFAPPPYNSHTSVPQAGAALLNGWACIQLSRDDRVRLINFPTAITDVVRQTIRGAWKEGIQTEKDFGEWGAGTWEFKLSGYPWLGQGSDAVPSKRLMCRLLQALESHGWHLTVSTDLSKKQYDKDTLFFRAGRPIQRTVFAITFNEWDKLRIIDAPSDQVRLAFIQTAHGWPQGVQDAKEKEGGCYQFKLRGYPWASSDGKEVTQARVFCMQILATFDQLGYELLATMDMNSGAGEDSGDVDSWFFASKS